MSAKKGSDPFFAAGAGRGSALVVALLLLAVAQVLILAVTTRAIVASHAARRLEDGVRALNAAEAGLAVAVQRFVRDNAPSPAEGRAGLVDWSVEADEELRAPSLSVATFTASSQCRSQSCRIRLRLVVRRDEMFRIVDMRKLDWERLPEPSS